MLNTATQARKPRIALMGEFSAGKSTLTNLLLGARPLPERVTATRLSPVWISSGSPGAEREHLDGTRTPISVEQIANVPIEDTRVIRLSFEAEMLDMFDLIDCPGISDPNMPVEVWERLVPEIDAVLWCTHATQAWRQSEATVWENIPEDVRKRSLLLITRFDKLKTERDRARVLARVSHETQDQFAGIYPMALLQALNADEDEEAWRASGAHDFTEALVAMIHDLQADGLADRSTATIAGNLDSRDFPRSRTDFH
ncbi:MAG: dynamin family protein [Planctomycetota bacterium]